MHRLTGIIGVLLCMGACVIAEASPVYYFTFDQAQYNPDTGNYEYTVQPGQSVTVNVYLYEYSYLVGETYMAPTPPNAAEGLQSVAAGLDILENSANATLTSIAGNTTSFDGFNTYLSGDEGFLHDVGVMSFQDGYTLVGAYGTAVDAETTAILIGSFTFEVAPDATFGSTMTIQATDLYSDIADNLSFETLTDLDALFDSSGYPIATLTVVPEPPSVVALCSLAMMGGLIWGLRRSRKVQKVQQS